MAKFLTDVHTHSAFSYDGKEELKSMLAAAYQKGLAFYGVAEHFDYDVFTVNGTQGIDDEEYFHTARHLQEDYAGCMNVLIGCEFGYTDDEKVHSMYLNTCEKYHPDFIVNSVHGIDGDDYYLQKLFDGKTKTQAYLEYLGAIRRSLDVRYPYDIVAHIGYITRYAPYENRELTLSEFGEQIDDILKTIIQKDKILEVNSKGGFLPGQEIVRRYYQLGGRKVSFASDAHEHTRIAENREFLMELLKSIGFTHIIVPCRGEHIKIGI